MPSPRDLIALSLLALAFSISGCSENPDRTGDPDGGIGAPGVNAPDAPQSEEEAYQRQMEEEAAFQKSLRGKRK